MTFTLATLTTLVGPAVAEEPLEPTRAADDSAATGAFVPLSQTSGSYASTARIVGIYDGARESTAIVAAAVASITERVQLAASFTYDDGDAQSQAEARLGLLEDETHGLDLQLAAGWDESGANAVPAVFAAAYVGHDLGGLYVIGNGRFDLGTEQSERGGSLGVASVRAVATALYAGVDSKLTLDLERDAMEPTDESSWSLQTGPFVTYVADRFSMTVSGGLAADKPRMASRELGAYGSVGIGAAF